MKVTVTQADIKEGERRRERAYYDCSSDCPVAIALRRAYPNNRRLWLWKWLTHDTASKFIDLFDHKQPVTPFEFECPMEKVEHNG